MKYSFHTEVDTSHLSHEKKLVAKQALDESVANGTAKEAIKQFAHEVLRAKGFTEDELPQNGTVTHEVHEV